MNPTGYLLQARDVRKHYGGVAALRGAHLDLRAGEVHALVGENGAGKSTLAKIIAGTVKADSGELVWAGGALEACPTVAMIYQELDQFPSLTVGENMIVGNRHFPGGRIDAFCRPFLDQVGLACDARQTAGELSIAQRQLLAIARALSMEARLILMDEPTSSLSEDAVERLFGLIRELQSRGVAMVYVSHKMDEIFRIAGRITVLRDGETIGTLDASTATIDQVIRMMVGRSLNETPRAPRRAGGEVLLAVEGLTTGKLRGVSFELRRGEVLGVAGLVGAGRSELGAALTGLDRISGGTVRYRDRATAGLIPEDRRLQGLMMSMSVLENGTLAALPRMQRLGWIRRGQERREFAEASRGFLKECSFTAPVATLSGGNQQKVLLARWLLMHPDVLFLDDPTRGVDVAAKQDIYRIIETLAAEGKGILLVSSELPELLRCADRILVLREGRLTAIYDANQATPENIMASATA